MTQFITETRERFLMAIAEQIASERIAEIHFFKPIKQGGAESVSYAYEYNFSEKNQTETFYDGLNFD